MNTEVNYLGLKLKNPFIAGSCGLTNNIDRIEEYNNAGVGAIVLKSVFEEQINNEAEWLNSISEYHPESSDYIQNYTMKYNLNNYLDLIKKSKSKCSVPIIASINCAELGTWTSFASKIEEAGADALEINFHTMQFNTESKSEDIELKYIKLAKKVKSEINIPIAFKISNEFTNLPRLISFLGGCGVEGVVLFNSFYQPDINLKTLELISAVPFSKKGDFLKELRWTAIVSSKVPTIDISASTGVHHSDDAVKLILSGAKTVQLCSVLYKHDFSIIEKFISGLEAFMENKGYSSIEDFRGKLNYSSIEDPDKYERINFWKK